MDADLFTKPIRLSGLYARVALERGIDSPEGLTYALPESLAGAEVGERVRAPLGKGDKAVEGYILQIAPDLAALGSAGLDPRRIKPLLGRTGAPERRRGKRKSRSGSASEPEEKDRREAPSADGGAGAPRNEGIPGRLVELAQWISGYYGCPIGLTLATMVPAAVKRQTGTSRRSVVGDPTAAHDAEASAAAPPSLTPAQGRAVEAIAATLGSFHPHLLFGVTGSGKTEVYLRVIERALDRGETAIVLVPEISLTPQTAGRFIGRFTPRLTRAGVAVLHSGLTGAQRHEQWRRAATGEARIVVGARSAVFAPYDERRGSKVGIIIVDEEHDSSYKQDQAPRYHARAVALRRGQLEACPVVLGSATPSLESWHNAAPAGRGGTGRFTLHRLPERVGGGRLPRVEVVDLREEERRRGRSDHRLRSIGPTLEEAIRRVLEGDEARRAGRSETCPTGERGGRSETCPTGERGGRSETCPTGGGGRIMLLLNRRGYASYISCPDRSCGWFLTCAHCDATVVYHRREPGGSGGVGGGVVRCHHCLTERRLPAVCPTCGKKINTFGFGTQRLEEELASLFPSLESGRTMLRLDGDSMRRASDYSSALERFRRGEARVLLGTQMIAKGLDFPDVELIGIINADTAINLPDFRAAERTFALVSQVAGRAGRGESSAGRARVIVQTMNPREPAITLAAAHDYEGFASGELELRREVGLPPIGRMARFVCRDEDEARARRRAREIHEALRGLGLGGVRVRPPAPCVISRIADQHRWSVEVMAESAGLIQRALAAVRGLAGAGGEGRVILDVDPVALL